MAENVFIALQNNPDAQPIIEAIIQDNEHAIVNESPGMVKIDCPKRLVIKRETVEEKLGREFELQDIHLTLISLSGNMDEDEDEIVLQWNF
ncbi:MAG: monooxygenase [Gammaproteobacteria bacterium]|jgi:phenol hydroxylase P2 protein|nr:monooxygenase [Gammaproteobacteria bacterium]